MLPSSLDTKVNSNQVSSPKNSFFGRFILLFFVLTLLVLLAEGGYYLWLSQKKTKSGSPLPPPEISNTSPSPVLIAKELPTEFHFISSEDVGSKRFENFTGLIVEKKGKIYLLENKEAVGETVEFTLSPDAQVIFFDKRDTLYGVEEFVNKVDSGSRVTIASSEGIIPREENNVLVVNRIYVNKIQ